MSKIKYFLTVFIFFQNFALANIYPSAPIQNVYPTLDTYIEYKNPTFAFSKEENILKAKEYELQFSLYPDFKELIYQIDHIQSSNQIVSITLEKTLKPETIYYWRVRSKGYFNLNSPWKYSRFTTRKKHLENNYKISCNKIYKDSNVIIKQTHGAKVQNLSDPHSLPNTIFFNFDHPQTLSTLWLLTSPHSKEGRFQDFSIFISSNGTEYEKLYSKIDHDSFHTTISLPKKPIQSIRIEFAKCKHGNPSIHNFEFYGPKKLKAKSLSSKDYVLVVQNPKNVLENHRFMRFFKQTNFDIEFKTISYDLLSSQTFDMLIKKPLALIILPLSLDLKTCAPIETASMEKALKNIQKPILSIGEGSFFMMRAYFKSQVFQLPSCYETESEISLSQTPFSDEEFNQKTILKKQINFGTQSNLAIQNLSENGEIFKINGTEHFGLLFLPKLSHPYDDTTKLLYNFLDFAIEKQKPIRTK
ncbi:MAG TPA: hypothetical protein P5048_04250 [Chlamydiales bacterium]|nr:hypothetical protein [Chlamydiales bacterium]